MMDQIVQIFKALADDTRLKILIILSKRRICAKGIAKHLNISEAAVSQHIKVLKETQLIIGEKAGYFIQYDLKEETLTEISKFIKKVKYNHENGEFEELGLLVHNCQVECKGSKSKCCQKRNERKD